MTRIVTRVHRPKRPAWKRKPVAIEAAIVRAGKPGEVRRKSGEGRGETADFRVKSDESRAVLRTSISRKRARLQRAEPAAEPDDDPEATARVRAFLDRMIRPR